MRSLRHTALLSLVVLLLASCTALPPITAPAAPAPEQPAATEMPAGAEPAPTAVEAAPAITTTVAMTPAAAVEPTAIISATAAVTTTEPAAQPAAPEAATPTSEQVMGANPLVGVVWEWAALLKTRPASQSVVPDPSMYTVVFNADGSMAIRADCNSASATYTLEDDVLTIVPGASTLVACPPGSVGDAMLTALSKVGSYMIDGGDLILRLADNGDSMLFRSGGPLAGAEAPAGAAPAATEAPAGAVVATTPTPAPVVLTPEAPAGTTSSLALQLAGTMWQWEKFTEIATGKTTIDVKNPEKYTLAFGADGTVAMKADCNSAAGTYKVAGTKLTIEVGPVTLAACGAGSLFDTYLINVTSAATYKIENGKLSVDLMADGGRMVFGAAQ